MVPKKMFIRVGVLLLIVGVLFLIFRNNNNELENTEEIIETSSRSFGIMVETDDGNYEKYTDSNTWPTNYVYNDEMSYCKDKDGNDSSVTMTYSNGKVTVTGNEATYCILYFRKPHTDSSLELLEILDQSNNVIGDCENTGNSYSCTVGSDVTAFKIRATVTDENATFTFTGKSTAYSGTATSQSYTLTAGSTLTKYVTVTAEDGSTTKYTVAVYKKSNDSTLKSISRTYGTWSTSCSGSTTSCKLVLGSGQTNTTLTPVANNSKATLSTTSITSGTLSSGSTTTKTVKVTSEDKSSTTTYTITIYKKSSDTTATITSSTGTWQSTCNASTTTCVLVTTACSSGSKSATLTATAKSSTATLEWSTTTVSASCNNSSSKTLTVTAEDGSTTTYTIVWVVPYSGGSSGGSGGSSSGGSSSSSSTTNNCQCSVVVSGVACDVQGSYQESEHNCTRMNSWVYYARVYNGVCYGGMDASVYTTSLGYTAYNYSCKYSGS